MRTRLYKYLFISLLTVFGITGLTGCGDTIEEHNYIGNILVNEYIEVKTNQWTWDDGLESYVYTASVKSLTTGVYNDGAVVASVFVNPETDSERMELLPYLFTYLAKDDTGAWYTYTETVSCSFSPGYVTFYLQASDRLDSGVMDNYEFKVSLIGDASLF